MMPIFMAAEDAATPAIGPIVEERYRVERAGAMWFWSTTFWSETKTALWATPEPKPLLRLVAGERYS